MIPNNQPSSSEKSQNGSPDYPWLSKYPPGIEWDQPIPLKPVWTLLDDTTNQIPHNPCINFLGKTYTYLEISTLVNQVAKGLQDLGIQQGDRIGIFMPNSVYFVIFYYGILKAGGVVVNYNPLYTDPEITHQIDDSDTKIMVTLDLKFLYDKIYKQLLIQKTSLKKIIVCPFTASLPWGKQFLFNLFKRSTKAYPAYNTSTILNFDTLIQNKGNFAPVTLHPATDLAVLQYTGGTTGTPKGAMLSHGNVYANALQTAPWVKNMVFGQDRVLVALPLFHVYAMTAAMTLATYIGAQMFLMFPRFDVKQAIKMIEKYKITLFPGVPTMYGMLIQHPKIQKFNLSSLKCCLSGGAGLPQQLKHNFEKLTGAKLTEAYGLSETSPGVTGNPPESIPSLPEKHGSIGIPFPQTIVKIFSLEDTSPWNRAEHPDHPVREMSFGEKGQIAVKGPQVMLGYWKRPQETQQNFVNDYFLTGDIGYMDEDGYIFLVDRLKDIIICSGFNVYPRMVEEAIYRHPAVSEVTVIGVPDEKRGETVKAFVKLQGDMTLTEKDLLDFLKDHLSPIEIPKYIEFREELPKTMIGKLSKKELKAELK